MASPRDAGAKQEDGRHFFSQSPGPLPSSAGCTPTAGASRERRPTPPSSSNTTSRGGASPKTTSMTKQQQFGEEQQAVDKVIVLAPKSTAAALALAPEAKLKKCVRKPRARKGPKLSL